MTTVLLVSFPLHQLSAGQLAHALPCHSEHHCKLRLQACATCPLRDSCRQLFLQGSAATDVKLRLGHGGGLLAALRPALDSVAVAIRLGSGSLVPDACSVLLLPGAIGFAQLPLPLYTQSQHLITRIGSHILRMMQAFVPVMPAMLWTWCTVEALFSLSNKTGRIGAVYTTCRRQNAAELAWTCSTTHI